MAGELTQTLAIHFKKTELMHASEAVLDGREKSIGLTTFGPSIEPSLVT